MIQDEMINGLEIEDSLSSDMITCWKFIIPLVHFSLLCTKTRNSSLFSFLNFEHKSHFFSGIVKHVEPFNST